MTNISVTLNGANLDEIRKQAMSFLATTETEAKPTRSRKQAAPTTSELPDETLDEVAEETVEESFDSLEDVSEETIEETPAKTAKKKTTKLTEKDVNEQAMAHAKKFGRPKTLEILNKKFKVKSILELKPEQYAAVILALKA